MLAAKKVYGYRKYTITTRRVKLELTTHPSIFMGVIYEPPPTSSLYHVSLKLVRLDLGLIKIENKSINCNEN